MLLSLLVGAFFSVNAEQLLEEGVLEPPPLIIQTALQELAAIEQADEIECFCVRYLRETFGIPIRGDALFVPRNTTLAEVRPGDVAIFVFGQGVENSHVARVQSITNGGITINERIKTKDGCLTRTRTIPFDYPALYGFHRPGV